MSGRGKPRKNAKRVKRDNKQSKDNGKQSDDRPMLKRKVGKESHDDQPPKRKMREGADSDDEEERLLLLEDEDDGDDRGKGVARLRPGSNAAFTVQSIDEIHDLFFMVISNDLIVYTGKVDGMGMTSALVSFPVSHTMEPFGHLIVYYFDNLGQIWNADSLYFEVNEGTNIFKNQISIDFDTKQAEPGESVNLQIMTDPQSLVNILAVDQSILLLGTGNDVTQQDVISSLKPASPPYTIYASQIHDPKQVMQTKGMQILTDMSSFSWAHPHYKRQIDCIPGTGTGTDAMGGGGPGAGTHLQTVERTREFFPETWLWTNTISRADGTATINSTVPDTITSWVATAFSVNARSGLAITGTAAKFTTFRPFFVSLNLPYSVVRGEEVAMQANIFNYMGQDLDVVVTLERSNDFRAIQHLSGGQVDYVTQDVVKTVKVLAGQAKSVFFPIIADIVGVAELSVKAQTLLAADGVKRQLIVEAEGTPVHLNVPVILSSGSPESVELSFPGNYVKDSEKIHVSAIGDIMGPTLKNLKQLLYLPTGCGEQTMTSFAPDVFIYNYLKTTNQLTPEIASMATDYMHRGYQRELTFQRTDGSFSIWGQRDYQGSMWLTAFVLKSFHQARPYIYVSDDVLVRAARWMSRHQQGDGSYSPVGSVHSTSLKGGANGVISLTAFVLIALVENDDVLIDYNSIQQAARARAYLEQHVYGMTNMYDLAISSYALAKAGSAQGSVAFAKLLKLATPTANGNRYWSSTTDTPQPSSWDYVYSRSPPLDIEISSYALLYLIQTHQLSEGLPVLRWLVSQRNALGGFRSTQDTVLGLQAMSEYGTMLSGNLDLDIGVAVGNFSQNIHIGRNDAMVLHLVNVPSNSLTSGQVTGHGHNGPAKHTLTLNGHGQGSALVHVSVTFNIETEVNEPAFNMTTTILHETLRSLVVETCAQYLVKKFTVDGMAVIEIDVPTGFIAEIDGSDVTKLPNVKKTEIKDQTVILYYDRILPTVPTCATIEMLRAELVAKTKPTTIRVYDYYEPDNRALDLYQSVLLKDSTICDICTDCGCTATVG